MEQTLSMSPKITNKNISTTSIQRKTFTNVWLSPYYWNIHNKKSLEMFYFILLQKNIKITSSCVCYSVKQNKINKIFIRYGFYLLCSMLRLFCILLYFMDKSFPFSSHSKLNWILMSTRRHIYIFYISTFFPFMSSFCNKKNCQTSNYITT
jgi:hypothetical protein